MGLFPTLLRRPDNILSMPEVGECLPGRRPAFIHGDPRPWLPGSFAAWEAAGSAPPMPWVDGQADFLLAPAPALGTESESLTDFLAALPASFAVALYEREQALWPNLLIPDGTAEAMAEPTASTGLRVFRSAFRHLGKGRTEAFLLATAGRHVALLRGHRRPYLRRAGQEALLNRRHLITSWEHAAARRALQERLDMRPWGAGRQALAPVERVFVLMPHFDDEVLQCGGAIHAAVAAGAEVELCWLTDGRRGVSTVSEESSARLRHEEAKEALARLGVSRFHFLDAPETRLRARGSWMAALRRLLCDFRPQRVHTVWFGDNNLDHFEANRVLAKAWPRGLERAEIAASGLWQPLPEWNRYLALDEAAVAAKEHALAAHASQLKEVDYLRVSRGLGSYYAADLAAPQAEAFICLPPAAYFAAMRASGMSRRLFL